MPEPRIHTQAHTSRHGWISGAYIMLSTRADILLTGQALRPLGQQDLPLPVRKVRVAFPPAQEPP
jgi:hypothetical protein